MPTRNTDSVINAAWLIRRYHGKAYQCKILSVVIIFVHRYFLWHLISTVLLEVYLTPILRGLCEAAA